MANEGSKLEQVITDLVLIICCSFQMVQKLVIGYDLLLFAIAYTKYKAEFSDSFSIWLLNVLNHFSGESYHRVREAIAAKFISFHWKDGKSNPADILSKHWEFATVWPMLKPILFWRGETATQLKGSDRIPSTTPGAEPPRDAKDSGSARPHSTHPETSSTNRP